MKPALQFAVLVAVLTAGLLVAGGYWTGGAEPQARSATIWAALVALVASVLGALPLVVWGPGGPRAGASGPAGVSRLLAAMLVRLLVVALGAAAVVVLGGVDVERFLIWLAVSYLVFLIAETALALRLFGSL